MVVAVAMFSSLAGLLMGLDIGYIAGVKPLSYKMVAVYDFLLGPGEMRHKYSRFLVVSKS